MIIDNELIKIQLSNMFRPIRPSSGLQNSGFSQGTFCGFYLWDPVVYNITTKHFPNYGTV